MIMSFFRIKGLAQQVRVKIEAQYKGVLDGHETSDMHSLTMYYARLLLYNLD